MWVARWLRWVSTWSEDRLDNCRWCALGLRLLYRAQRRDLFDEVNLDIGGRGMRRKWPNLRRGPAPDLKRDDNGRLLPREEKSVKPLDQYPEKVAKVIAANSTFDEHDKRIIHRQQIRVLVEEIDRLMDKNEALDQQAKDAMFFQPGGGPR